MSRKAILVGLICALLLSGSPVAAQDKIGLARAICGIADMYYGHEDAGEKIEGVLLDAMKRSNIADTSRSATLAFWNRVDEGLICNSPSQIKPNARTPQHFLKRVVDLRMENQIFYEFLLFDSETHPEVDVNAVEMVDGRGETLLDYIDAILAAGPDRQKHYDIQQLRELRDVIVEEYGATTSAELSD